MSHDTEPCCALWRPYVRHEHEYGCPSFPRSLLALRPTPVLSSEPIPYVLSHPAVGALEELLAALDVPGKPDTTEDQLFRILRAVDHARDVVSEARLAE